MAIITDFETHTERVGKWYNWVRRWGTSARLVRINELPDGGAHVTITTPTQKLEEVWASYQVAKGYFGPPRGWRGSKVLKHAPKLFVNRHGEIEYDTYTEDVPAPDAWTCALYQGKWTVFYNGLNGQLIQSAHATSEEAVAEIERLRAEVRV